MRRALVAIVVAVSMAWLLGTRAGAAQEVTGDTRLLATATYVAIGFGGGGGGFISDVDSGKAVGVSQEDRTALVEVRKQFEKWHRYVVTNFPDQADVLVTVRVGRRGSVTGSVPVGGRPPGTGLQRGGAGVGSPDDDMLCAYTNATMGGRKRLTLVWQRASPNGLSGNPAPLFQEFRLAIDAASMQKRP